jgi:hypothetical protein
MNKSSNIDSGEQLHVTMAIQRLPVQERECGYDRRHPWLAATRSIPLRAVTSSPLGGLEEMSVKTITNTQTAKKTAFLF